ncbi:MAG: hypothetical protein RR330_07330 [Alistipes sp.]
MKNFNLFAVATAMLTLVSCAKETEAPPTPDNGEKMAVTLQIASPDDVRSIEAPALDGEKVTLASGIVFFMTTGGDVVSVQDLKPAEALTADGQLFAGVSKSAKQVYIVGNSATLPADDVTKLKACATMIGLKAVSSSILSQQQTHKNVVVVNALDATNFPDHTGLIVASGVEPIKYKACVLLAPVLSRIQIADILTIDPNIVSFDFAGVAVDGYYTSFYMATEKGGAGVNYTVNQTAGSVGVPATTMCDMPTVAIPDGGDKKITAAEAKATTGTLVWAYQTTPTLGGATFVPRIIVKLTNIVLRNADGTTTSIAGPKFLTVTGYKAGSTQVLNFEAGKIYNIPAGGFTFKYQDLDNDPNPLKISVNVCVAIKPWTVVGVTPQL